MYNQPYKLSSSKIRAHHSQDLQVKKSNSSKLTHKKSIVSKLLFDKADKKAQVQSFLKQQKQQVPFLRITNRRSSSFDKKAKIVLKPITSRRQQQGLPELLGISQSNRQKNNGQGQVEQQFYRQVRIMQQFKKLAQLVQ